jgi:transaldolase / glucose-6-phosphate isomerase
MRSSVGRGLIMKDAGIEAKRHSSSAVTAMKSNLGPYEEGVQSALKDATQVDVIRRIWNKDASLWKSEPSHQKTIKNSLGWLTVAHEMLGATAQLEGFAAEIRAEYRHVMVCGMGGSSLCPEVLRNTFGPHEGFPTLLVLDSTDPDVVDNFSKQIDVTRCLFAVASKSGTTTEPLAFHRYWFNEVSKKSASPGDSFIAITDPETQMAATASAEGFKHTFLNQPDIGGRYSALSYFGMVPAALMGLDVQRLLQRADAMADLCRGPIGDNPAALLGAVMAECALAGRDKLTIVADEQHATLGLWIEQLVAESTGKEGKGIIPVVGETLGDASVYGDDRVFVSISSGNNASANLKALEDAGHPAVYRTLNDVYDLGAEFFVWELATAFAGWRLGINPFDQPNVQEAKDATKVLLDKYSEEGKLDDKTPIARDGEITVYTAEQATESRSVEEVLVAHIAKAVHGDYVALLVYLEESPEIDAALQTLRTTLRDVTGCAATSGYGPRYLHSTGQLHKGGPDTGVFLQITAPDKADFEVPGAPYSFSLLKQAQAQGDLEALRAHGRRAIRVDLGTNIVAGIQRLTELVRSK